MLNTVGDLQTELLVRSHRTTADSFITDTFLQDWTRQAHTWAASQHKWPFTEGRVSTTFTTGSGANSDEWYFEGYKADSFRLVQVGGKELRPLDWRNYQKFLEEQPSSNDRVFATYGRGLFINPRVDASGTLTAWGQYQPVIDPTDLTAETIFTNWDAEANEAILTKMLGYLRRRENDLNGAAEYDKQARAQLDEVWQRVQDEQYKYQTHSASGGMWEYIDVLKGDYSEEVFKRDQFI